jgi:IclR family acetate operon transcriptional repressor
MHASSVGKAMMATLPDEAVFTLLHRSGMPRFTDQTIVDPDALIRDLALVRKRGWSIDDREQSEGMRCVGAAVYNEYREVVGALSISGPTVRVTDERVGELGPMVKRAAAEITNNIGGKLPGSR